MKFILNFTLLFLLLTQAVFGAGKFSQPVDNWLMGKASSGSNKVLEADIGLGVNNPKMRYSIGTSAWQFSNNGITFDDFGSGGGGGSASSNDTLDFLNILEQANIRTDGIDGTFREAFKVSDQALDLWLMDTATATASTITAVVAPVFAESSDKIFDTSTNWTAFGAATTISTSATHKVGSLAVSFNKDNTATTAAISNNVVALNLQPNSNAWYWANLPTVTGVDSVVLYVCKDTATTNCNLYNSTTNYAGSALIAGWNLIKVDLTQAATSNIGTGWTLTDRALNVLLGVKTTLGATTLTGVLMDGLAFSLADNSLAYQKGDQQTIYNATNSEEIIIDSANSLSEGVLTLAGALTNTYLPVLATHIQRHVLSLAGDGKATFRSGVTGTAELTQGARKKDLFRAAVAGQPYTVSVKAHTPLQFVVSSVDSTTQIKVVDSTDYSAEFLNGDKYYVFQSLNKEGKKKYIYRNLVVNVNASATNGGGLTTIQNSGTNAGIVAGDTVVKGDLETFVSLVGASVNESYGAALTESDFLLEDIGLPYPGGDKVVGHYHLGSTPSNDGIKNLKGVLPNLGITGVLNQARTFLNGLFGAGPYPTTGDYFLLPGGSNSTALISGDSSNGAGKIAFSFWVYRNASEPSGAYMVVNSTTIPGGNSWLTIINAAGQLSFQTSGGNLVAQSAAVALGSWHHMLVNWDEGVSSSIFVDGIKTVGTISGHVYTGDALLSIGNTIGASTQLANTFIADLVLWSNYNVSDADAVNIYAAGKHILLGPNPFAKHIYTTGALTGQKMTVKVNAKRRTNAVAPVVYGISAAEQ